MLTWSILALVEQQIVRAAGGEGGSGQLRLPWTHHCHRQHTPVDLSLGVETHSMGHWINTKGRWLIDRKKSPQNT